MVVEHQPTIPLVRRALLGHRAVLGIADQSPVGGDASHVPTRGDQIGERGVCADILEATVGIVLVEAAAARIATVDREVGRM